VWFVLVVLLVLFFVVLMLRRHFVAGQPLWPRRGGPDGPDRRTP
jgi:hypothetical protein